MHKLIELSEKVEAEVGKIASKPELSLVDIEAACKAVELMKKIEETLEYKINSSMMDEEEMYGRRGYGDYGRSRRGSNGRYRRSSGNQYGYGASYMDGYHGMRYGVGSDKEMMIENLETMMASSNNEQVRQIIAETVDRINRTGK